VILARRFSEIVVHFSNISMIDFTVLVT